MDTALAIDPEKQTQLVDFQTHPSRYQHWQLKFDGPIATLVMDTKEDGGIRQGYKLKLNSYDLGVDIELRDALQRIRFEHPEVRAVVITSARQRVFCSGANIYMLGTSSHAWKVNFCKFTNETRNGIEEASHNSGLKFLAACNGTTAGGGYELALACDEIVLIDDRSSAVSLPEVPLLGVLPGTGGLTRVIDKRKVRRDLADIFCTTPEGIQGQRAKDWRLVDDVIKPAQWSNHIQKRAQELAEQSDRPVNESGVELTPLKRTIDQRGYHYEYVDVIFDREGRTATITVRAPESATARTLDEIKKAGASWWPLQMARELDDAILTLRTNELELGLWIFKTSGNADAVLEIDRLLVRHRANWFVREVINMLRRAFSRLDVASRSLYAVIEEGSCFAGTLFELVLAADRSYMLNLADDPAATFVAISEMNFAPLIEAAVSSDNVSPVAPLACVTGMSRLAARFYGDEEKIASLRSFIGKKISAEEAAEYGLVTAAPDDLDWADELRLAVESRVALSPDALTGMEANLRFAQPESMMTRIFGRLSAWQNWIFIRPNAVGQTGALKVYGSGNKAKFNWERV
ncbi:MAG TPA: 2,3-epoxybenzoyl-CoA dihydrolase [Terriglobales bacterium]|nr:2,3-epoxybenzoyl-CoA dihydrolase [Terriglobales bacterium]